MSRSLLLLIALLGLAAQVQVFAATPQQALTPASPTDPSAASAAGATPAGTPATPAAAPAPAAAAPAAATPAAATPASPAAAAPAAAPPAASAEAAAPAPPPPPPSAAVVATTATPGTVKAEPKAKKQTCCNGSVGRYFCFCYFGVCCAPPPKELSPEAKGIKVTLALTTDQSEMLRDEDYKGLAKSLDSQQVDKLVMAVPKGEIKSKCLDKLSAEQVQAMTSFLKSTPATEELQEVKATLLKKLSTAQLTQLLESKTAAGAAKPAAEGAAAPAPAPLPAPAPKPAPAPATAPPQAPAAAPAAATAAPSAAAAVKADAAAAAASDAEAGKEAAAAEGRRL